MISLTAMTGGLDFQGGFENYFSFMVPLFLGECDNGDGKCKDKQKITMALMMAIRQFGVLMKVSLRI